MSRIRIVLIIGILLLLGVVCAPAAASWPDTAVYAPYVDVSLSQPYFVELTDMKTACGVNYSTLCFVNADEKAGNAPAWGGRGNMIDITEQKMIEMAKEIRAAGGDIIISFGGADAGAYSYTLAQKWTDVDQLTAQYQTVIDLFDATWIDFDVEQNARTDKPSVDRRNKAIKKLKDNPANAGLRVAYCLPCQPESGFDAFVTPILDNASWNDADIDYWNAMAMDYGTWFTHNLSLGTNMSKLGILAAENISSQLQTKFDYSETVAYEHMGYTPMIGQTDYNDIANIVNYTYNEVFWLNTSTNDATVIRDFVRNKNISVMGAWSANRDSQSSVRELKASPCYSGVPQNPYDFSKIFVTIEWV
jgi:hypothetical protein